MSTESRPAGGVSWLKAFRDPRLLLMMGLGFASGLPNPLSHSVLKAWLTDLGFGLGIIGLFALVRLPYNFKFLWAPFVDRYALPFLTRRRSWIFLCQIVLFASVGALGTYDPSQGWWLTWALAFNVAFFSATLDITADAYRTDILPAGERTNGTAVWVSAFRIALIVAGGGALILSDYVPWTVVYWAMATLMLLTCGVTLWAQPISTAVKPPTTFKGAVIDPFVEFIGRENAFHYLVIIMLYRIGEVVAGHYRIPFLLELEFSRSELGIFDKVLGLGFTIVGALLLVGSGIVKKWGIKRAMIALGIAQSVTNALYALLAASGKSYPLLFTAISVDNLTNGMGTAVFVAFLMTLCNKRYTAFQFALFSSLMTVPGLLISGGGGAITRWMGWPSFYLATVFLGFPALIVLWRIDVEEPDSEAAPEETS